MAKSFAIGDVLEKELEFKTPKVGATDQFFTVSLLFFCGFSVDKKAFKSIFLEAFLIEILSISSIDVCCCEARFASTLKGFKNVFCAGFLSAINSLSLLVMIDFSSSISVFTTAFLFFSKTFSIFLFCKN